MSKVGSARWTRMKTSWHMFLGQRAVSREHAHHVVVERRLVLAHDDGERVVVTVLRQAQDVGVRLWERHVASHPKFVTNATEHSADGPLDPCWARFVPSDGDVHSTDEL